MKPTKTTYKRILILLCLAVFQFSCNNSTKKAINFYHWTTSTDLSEKESSALQSLGSEEIYMRFFDIKLDEEKVIYPEAVIRSVDKQLKEYKITPVVYIVNDVLKTANIQDLSTKIGKLVDEMYTYHFKTNCTQLQLDCDWTLSTKEQYFELIIELGKRFEISSTIRLHQLKYPDKTGIPPCEKGTLMVYNTGQLKDFDNNSILTMKTVKSYVNKNTEFPLELDIALPVYSWAIIKHPYIDQIKIMNGVFHSDLQKEKFTKINEFTYKVKKPHYLGGYYLQNNMLVKVEEVNFELIKEIHDYLRANDGINWANTVLYHLDDNMLQHYSNEQLNLLR